MRVETKINISNLSELTYILSQLRLWDLIYLHIVLERTVGSWSLYKIKDRICQRKGNDAIYFPLFTYTLNYSGITCYFQTAEINYTRENAKLLLHSFFLIIFNLETARETSTWILPSMSAKSGAVGTTGVVS